MRNSRQVLVLGAFCLATALLTEAAQSQGRGAGQGSGQVPARGPGTTQGPAQGQRSGSPASRSREGNQQTPRQQEIRDRLRNRDIYGGDLMTAEERDRYRERVNAATSDREWARIREEHMNEIRARAQSQGRSLEPPVYGAHMMTARERNDYQRRLRSAASDAERDRIRAEHRAMIRDRAMQLGLQPPPLP
jgi:hypothetical protein